MLLLLLNTRLRYYRNYLRHHFDRVVWFELGFIILILLYLTGRSPADIGYSLDFLREKDFSEKYVTQWIMLLPIFYLSAEALAFVTLRPTSEWQILGTLPIAQPVITKYHLLRHGVKAVALLFIGTIPFLVGESSGIEKLMRFGFTVGMLLTLQLASFMQASGLRNTAINLPKRILRWLVAEAMIICMMIGSKSQLQSFFTDAKKVFLVWPTGWILFGILFLYLRLNGTSSLIESQSSHKPKKFGRVATRKQPALMGGIISVLIWRDIKFLWTTKRSIFVLIATASMIILLAGLAQASATEAYASSIVLEGLFGFMLINALLILFEHDAQTAVLQRSLPFQATDCWKARWLLASGLMIVPIISTFFVIPFFFSVDTGFIFFSGLTSIIPMIFSAVYCNAGFGLFPNIKFCSLLLNILLGLMILFWFYMPFGTVILLMISGLWIRKSQQHFQFWEIK